VQEIDAAPRCEREVLGAQCHVHPSQAGFGSCHERCEVAGGRVHRELDKGVLPFERTFRAHEIAFEADAIGYVGDRYEDFLDIGPFAYASEVETDKARFDRAVCAPLRELDFREHVRAFNRFVGDITLEDRC